MNTTKELTQAAQVARYETFGFPLCGIYAIYSTRLVGVVIDDELPAVSWLSDLDHCGTRWLPAYSPPPPWAPKAGWEPPFVREERWEWWRKHMCSESPIQYVHAKWNFLWNDVCRYKKDEQ